MSVETAKPQACTEMSVKWRHHEAVPQARPQHRWPPRHQGHGAGQRLAVAADRAEQVRLLQRNGAYRRLPGRSDGSRGDRRDLPPELLLPQPHQHEGQGGDRAPELGASRPGGHRDHPRRVEGRTRRQAHRGHLWRGSVRRER